MLNELNVGTKQWSIWSAQLMLSNEKCNICAQSCSTMIWQTFRTSCQSWRHKGRSVCNLTVDASQSRLKTVCQTLTNSLKTLLCWSQLLHSCATFFKKMLRLISLHKKFKHCFTWTHQEWRMRLVRVSSDHSIIPFNLANEIQKKTCQDFVVLFVCMHQTLKSDVYFVFSAQNRKYNKQGN